MEFPTALLEDYFRAVAATVQTLAEAKEGRQVLGGVPGRTAEEDETIGVDAACEAALEEWCRRNSVDALIYSEHGASRPLGRPGAPQYVIASDPFDGSGLFRRGLPAEWWSVLSVFGGDGLDPVAGGALDILRREVYLADAGGVTWGSLGAGQRSPVSPSPQAALDDTSVIAAFFMDPLYLNDWTEKGGRLLRKLTGPLGKVRFWPNGGSCIYPWLARGLVHAYVMFEEPRSEIDPGLAFAWAAGFPVYSVDGGGRLRPYRFVPGAQADREPFLVAACTPQLAAEIVAAVLHG
jgi:fructose-1,6-bisphosphatase/inositol monophosphatase family enzyme